MSERAYDAILFDAGGIFVVPDPRATGAVLEANGANPTTAALVRAHYAGMAAQDAHAGSNGGRTLEAGDWTAYREAYARAGGVPVDRVGSAVRGLARVFSPYLWCHPLHESIAALARLHRAGVPIGIVSNASGQIEATLANVGACQVGTKGAGVPVTCVVDSHVVGVAKPDPAIFAPALDALGLPPERVAYVGDSVVNDIAGAAAAGLHPIQLDPYDDQAGATHVRVASLHELVAAFT